MTRGPILHVISGLFYGGGQQVALDLLEGLPRVTDVPVELCILGELDGKMTAAASHRVAYDGRYNRPDTLWRLRGALRRVLRQVRPSVVHTHGWDATMGVALARQATATSQVVHWHTTDEWLKARTLRHSVRRSMTRWCFRRRATAVAAVAGTVRQHLADRLGWPADRIGVIHNGIDIRKYEPNGMRIWETDPDRPLVVGTAARLMPMKGLEYLIDALAIAKENGVTCEWRVAGEGTKRPQLEQRVSELGLEDCVHWLGRLDDTGPFYRELDAFVLPSLSEGLPLTILEAMASGTPVLATRVGGIPEAVRDGEEGVLVPPRDAKALAEALGRLAQAPESRAGMGDRARRRVEQEFTIDRVAERFLSLYDQLLQDN